MLFNNIIKCTNETFYATDTSTVSLYILKEMIEEGRVKAVFSQ